MCIRDRSHSPSEAEPWILTHPNVTSISRSLTTACLTASSRERACLLYTSILLSAVIIIWRGAGRGLVKSVMGLVTSVVSFVVAYAYTPVLADIVRDKYLSEPITNGIFETLKSLAFDTNTDLYNLDRLAVDMPEPFTSILERYNVNITTFTEKIKGIKMCIRDR